MNIPPKISVLMSVYNAEKYLNESIDSVLSQTFKDYEFLILDDGSTDRSKEIIRSYSDRRIRFEPCQHDFISTLNKGIEIARGKYIARMDADDIMMPNRLQVQYDFMEKHTDIAACGSFITFIGNEEHILERPTSPDKVITSLMLFCAIANPSSIIRRKILIDHHIRYEYNFVPAEDYKLWTELAKYGQLANIPQVLLKYRISETQQSIVYKDRQDGLTQEIRKDMILYFLSHIEEKDSILIRDVKKKLIPCLEQLLNESAISSEVYSQFMYSLVCGLREKKFIQI